MSVINLKKNKETFKGGLLVENPVYKPFRYPWCYDAWLTQQRIHWLPEEVPLGDDVRDWQKNITPAVSRAIFCFSPVPNHIRKIGTNAVAGK